MAKLTSAEKLTNKNKKIQTKVEAKSTLTVAKQEQKLVEVAKHNLQEFNKKSDSEKQRYYEDSKRDSDDMSYNTINDTDDFNFKSKFVDGDFTNKSSANTSMIITEENNKYSSIVRSLKKEVNNENNKNSSIIKSLEKEVSDEGGDGKTYKVY
jgi:vacuolar-type H+-ATPase subunit H